MATPLRALIIEDSQNDCDLLLSMLGRGGYDVAHKRVCNAATLGTLLEEGQWDIVISDYSMPGFKGTDALAMVRKKGLDVPFVFLSGTIGEEIAVNAMRAGAQDYVIKGKAARLLPAIQRELREAELRRERRQMEQRVRQLEKFEALGKLAGGVSHDFNNVIGAIMGWAELGVDRVSFDSPEAKLFRNIREQATRAAGLTRQLLAYARRQVLEPKNINLNHMVNETTSLLQKAIGEQIEVKIMLAPELQTTRADPSQIEQVIMNLCFNARDAMPKGGHLLIETRNVELDSDYCERRADAQPGRYIQLSVSDTGAGMDPATMERIFEPFFTTKEIGKGTGLGLATVFGIVKQHEVSALIRHCRTSVPCDTAQDGHGLHFALAKWQQLEGKLKWTAFPKWWEPLSWLLLRPSYLLAIRSELRFPHSQYRPGFLFCHDDVQTGSRPVSQHFEHPQHSKNGWLWCQQHSREARVRKHGC
jgi:signal transduction histidine kinase